MKSHLFTDFIPESDGGRLFNNHLQLLLTLDPKYHKDIVEDCIKYAAAKIAKEEKEITEVLSQKVNIDINTLVSLFDVTSFFLRGLTNEQKRDQADDIFDDAKTLGYLADKHAESNFRAFLRTLVKKAPEYEEMADERAFESGVVPGLRSLGSTVEMRAIQKDIHRFGVDVNDYAPQIVGVVPVASIRIRLTDDTKVHFQVSPKELELLIDSFRASHKDLKALVEYVSKRKEPSGE